MRLRFSDVKTACAKVLNLSSTDARVLDYVNRAQERLLYEGKWMDTYIRYAICTTENCLTWPRDIETIEHVAICDVPGIVRNGWYEFLENGPGLINDDCGPSLTLVDRGNAITFDDVTSTGYKLEIYADGTEAAGDVLLRYYDLNGNKVYSGSGANTYEGENLAIPAAGGYTLATYEVLPYGLYHVSKPVTRRHIRLYAHKISDGTRFPLAYYEPDEEVPVYRRSFITELGGTTGSSCESTSVTVIGKLRFIQARVDASVLMISHTDAIRLACQAVKKEEDNLLGEAEMYWLKAKQCLDRQLAHWQGDGVVAPIRVTGNELCGPGVVNMI
jgi:hypothetical protein